MQRPPHMPSPVFFLPAKGFTLYYISKTHKIVSCQTLNTRKNNVDENAPKKPASKLSDPSAADARAFGALFGGGDDDHGDS